MKTLKQFLLPVLESFEVAWQVIRYALIFVSAFFRQARTAPISRDSTSTYRHGNG